MEEPTDFLSSYPPKPPVNVEVPRNRAFSFVISVVAFGAFYYFFLSKDWQVIAWLIAIVFIHELGHYLAMKLFNYQDLSIFFIPLVGAVAGGTKERISQREKATVLMAGPVPGIIIGLVLFALSRHYQDELLLKLAYAFVVLNLLNLLPVYPLDGGQLLSTLFLGSKQLISDIFIIISIVLIAGYGLYYREWFVLIVPYFLIRRMLAERDFNRVRRLLKEKGINYEQSYDELSDAEYWQLRDILASNKLVPTVEMTAGHHEPADNENQVIAYIKSVLQPRPVRDLSRAGSMIFVAIWLLSFILPVLILMPRDY